MAGMREPYASLEEFTVTHDHSYRHYTDMFIYTRVDGYIIVSSGWPTNLRCGRYVHVYHYMAVHIDHNKLATLCYTAGDMPPVAGMNGLLFGWASDPLV
jgi:hypothetical protein